jgi:signal transduction histidine kinase
MAGELTPVGGARPRDRDVVQRLLAWLYGGSGSRLLVAIAGVVVIEAVVALAATVLWGHRYLGVTPAKVWEAAAIAAPMTLCLLSGAAWWTRASWSAIASWPGNDRSGVHAGQVWSVAVELPYRLPVCLLLLMLAAAPPLVPPMVILLTDVSFSTSVGYLLCGLVGALAGLVPVAFSLELLLRPLLEDVAASLPPDFEPSRQGWRVRTKAVVALPSVTLFGALTVGAFTSLAVSGLLRLVIAVGIALVAIAVAGAIFWLVMRSLLEPVDDLLAATRRVSGGDIATPVPVVTGDELGSLAAGFNRMLADLRGHEQELRESRARIVAAADDARRRVERDLHDGAQQQLVLLGLKLAMMERLAGSDPAAATAMLPEARRELDRSLQELRELARGIYPQLLESDGLPGALRDAAQRATANVEVQCDGAGRYPAEVESAVYFCCLEALQNAIKHAGPDARIEIKLGDAARQLSFEVTDDGPGFEPAANGKGAGLQNMADRLGALGGELLVSSPPGLGTTVRGTVPLHD